MKYFAYFCTQNLSSEGHCTSSRGSKYNDFVSNLRPGHWTRTADICSTMRNMKLRMGQIS